jgi:hypothetical protein
VRYQKRVWGRYANGIRRLNKVVYIAPAIVGDWVGFDLMMPNNVLFDWIERLSNKFIDSGWDFAIRSHPSSRSRYPLSLTNRRAIRFVDRCGFKEVLEQNTNALFICDFPGSSAFGEVLQSNSRVLFIVFGFHGDTYTDIETRFLNCIRVKGYFSEYGRAIVDDWSRVDVYEDLEDF